MKENVQRGQRLKGDSEEDLQREGKASSPKHLPQHGTKCCV